MTKRKVFYITGIFFIVLTLIRLLWISVHYVPEHPSAMGGVLDLRGYDIEDSRSITLDGEWEFYSNRFIMGSESAAHPSEIEQVMVSVPGSMSSILSETSGSPLGYGSYRLRILIDPSPEQKLAIRMPTVLAASEVYANGELVGQSGRSALSEGDYEFNPLPYLASFTTSVDEIELVIHAVNDVNSQRGGLDSTIKFGSSEKLQQETSFTVAMQLMVSVILLIHVVYAIILYWIGTRQKTLIYFSLFISCAVLSILVADDRLLFNWVAVNYEWYVNIRFIAYVGVSLLLLEFVKRLLPEYTNNRTLYWFTLLSVGYLILIVVLPSEQLYKISRPANIIFVTLPFAMAPMMMLRSVLRNNSDAIYLLVGATALLTNIIWAGKFNELFHIGYYPVDMIAACVALACFWFKRYFRIAAQTDKLAKQLQRADKMKDEFLANTSHELRNPLHGILNIAQTVLESGKSRLDDGNVRNMELLITMGRRMSFLLNDLLDLTRLREGGIRLQAGRIQIQSVAVGVFDMLRFMTEGKAIQFEQHIPPTFPSIAADPDRIIQILFNLLHNAVKYTNEGTIALQAEVRDGWAVIHVIDTGIGMDEETLQRVFQPYEQGDSSMTAVGGGIGLGLAICKQLVSLHGGTLEASSTQGQGSTFTFTMPLHEAAEDMEYRDSSKLIPLVYREAAVAELKSEPIADNNTRATILIVDDDPINLTVLEGILSPQRYNIVKAASGHEALELLETREWDLVIADVMMPKMSGYELTQAIRNRFYISELPVLLLTARSRPEDIEAGFRSGASDYVTKPVEAMELRSRVRALTELKQSVRERLRMEGAWLQAQIQPHFLFNTLNAVVALSDIDHNRMRKLLEEFSNYLRASFDFQNSSKLVPLEHELGLVRSYLYIEKQRFEDKLQINWEVEGSPELLIPPLSIQPLVENALRHGILKRMDGGKVTIRISGDVEQTEVSVIDNGVGMDSKTLELLLDSNSYGNRGIGLRNTDRRLKQQYGQGLQIQSRLNEGTTVSFTVFN